MSNPFETIDTRLASIECLLLDIKKEKTLPLQTDADEIFGIQEAAEFLRLKVPTIYSLTSKRILPSFKRGKRVYFKKSELKSWLEVGKRKSLGDLESEAKNYVKSKTKTI